jgi:hypothetical protein
MIRVAAEELPSPCSTLMSREPQSGQSAASPAGLERFADRVQ